MSDAENGRSANYSKTRTAFDKMSMEEQATFLVDAALSMVTHGVGEATKVVSQVIDDIVSNIDVDCESAEPEKAAEAPKEPKKAPAKPRATRKKSTTPRKPRKPKSDG